MQPRIKILLVYLVLLALALALSGSIVLSGRAISHDTTDLAETKLPRLQGINDLYLALIEHERLLYEYYATTNADQFNALIDSNQQRIRRDLALIDEAFPDWQPVQALREKEQQVRDYTRQLDEVFRAERVDWDRARALLQMVSDAGRTMFPLLDQLVEAIKQDAVSTAQATRNTTERSSSLVVAFALLVLVSAGFVGFYVNSYIRDSINRRRLAMFAERSPNPIMSFSWRGRLGYTNPACERLMQRLGNHSRRAESLLPEDFPKVLLALQKSSNDYSQWVARISSETTLQYSLSLLRDLDTCHLYIEDISEQVEANRTLEYQAYHDVLTELPNRRCFNEAVAALVTDIRADKPFSVLLISVDRFDQVVASVGYQLADQVLQAIAHNLERILNNVSSQKVSEGLFRLDSSKFAVLLDDIPEPGFAERIAAEVLEDIKAPFCVDNNEFHISVSIGISHYPEQGSRGSDIIANADAALGRVTREGGDDVLCYNQQLHASEQAWVEVERGLRNAIEAEELVLFYQPKIDAKQGTIAGVEALIRWRRSDGSMVSPAEFIPVAEQSGLIVMIGEWVVQQACRQFEHWQNEVASVPLSIAVNLSARQFRHPDFLRMMEECLHHYAIDPALIELEITESLLMNDIENSIKTMHQLKAMGFKLSIDDFGTGYSSLSYLKDFPIDKLKIDRAFVMNIETNPEDRTLVKTIVDLAHNLNLTVVAEGVEDAQQLAILQQLGVEEIQGFYFSKPLPAEDISQRYLAR